MCARYKVAPLEIVIQIRKARSSSFGKSSPPPLHGFSGLPLWEMLAKQAVERGETEEAARWRARGAELEN